MAYIRVPRARAESCQPRADRTVTPAWPCLVLVLLVVLSWTVVGLAVAAALSVVV